ncbi:hypothetical protein C8R45DRAFT_1080771 [Mycena sanguinolenta]|nr:hypothetical protein C8R45DRAFT_1080771 [Mycena sanguinolenta]
MYYHPDNFVLHTTGRELWSTYDIRKKKVQRQVVPPDNRRQPRYKRKNLASRDEKPSSAPMTESNNANPVQSKLYLSAGGATRAVSLDGKTISVPLLTIEKFCETYDLDKNIKELLENEAFGSAGALLEVSEEELRKANFKLGQVAELKRALREWLDALLFGPASSIIGIGAVKILSTADLDSFSMRAASARTNSRTVASSYAKTRSALGPAFIVAAHEFGLLAALRIQFKLGWNVVGVVEVGFGRRRRAARLQTVVENLRGSLGGRLDRTPTGPTLVHSSSIARHPPGEQALTPPC